MTLRWILGLVLACAAVAPAVAQQRCPSRRNVDCAGAERAIDAAIAADPWLSLLEDGRRRRVAELQRLLPREATAVLTEEDAIRRRARSRELFFTADGAMEAEGAYTLRSELEWWLIRLIRMQDDPPDGVAGHWTGAFAEARIRPLGGGRYLVTANAAEPYALSWLCEFEAEGVMDATDTLIAGAEGEQIAVRREGPMLRIRSIPRPGRAGFDYCGAMGSLSGSLFRIGDAE
ncbi:hypothetical protein GXW74_09440 [Roseomonas eburnea]|uniref:Uncharacterized protein n=1 Tax=Neoroseomonas eburnea TaxID=1346889 RepID=A0A9X9XAH5_9PROT|nr:hypothetical protein [Neoroseomonas eburnea]MBR0680711.1 hypothetical protein [Neoroseomonas eburnea]